MLNLNKFCFVFRKSKEIYDLISLKGNLISLNDSAKTMISIELAAQHLNIPFESQQIIKCSAMTKKSYVNSRDVIMKLLNFNKKLDVAGFMLKVGILNKAVETRAKRIFEACERNWSDQDLDHPQYVSMSVYHASKLEKLKVSKNLFLKASNLKSKQWSLLEKSFESLISNIPNSPKKEKRQDIKKENEGAAVRTLKRKHETVELDDYDEWAKKTIAEAEAELQRIDS